MVDKIPKIPKENYWAVDALNKSDEDKEQRNRNQRDDQERGREYRKEFEEFSDFTKLVQNNPKNYENHDLEKEQVDAFVFRSVSTQGTSATLEVDICFSDGSVEKGVRIAVGREEGMGYLGKKPGEPVAIDQIFKGSSLMTVGLFRPKNMARTTLLSDSPHSRQGIMGISWLTPFNLVIGSLLSAIILFLGFLIRVLAS